MSLSCASCRIHVASSRANGPSDTHPQALAQQSYHTLDSRGPSTSGVDAAATAAAAAAAATATSDSVVGFGAAIADVLRGADAGPWRRSSVTAPAPSDRM